VVCITATIGKKRHKKVVWANCLVNDRSLRVPQLGSRAKSSSTANGLYTEVDICTQNGIIERIQNPAVPNPRDELSVVGTYHRR
jgi:hypothetical protein